MPAATTQSARTRINVNEAAATWPPLRSPGGGNRAGLGQYRYGRPQARRRRVLRLVEVPGEAGSRDGGGEEGCYQADNDRRLDAVSRPPQLIVAEKQPP